MIAHEEADDRKRDCCGALRFFAMNAYRDVKRNKCHFCLAFSAVLIVVLSTLLVNTIVSKGPLVFLNLAEAETGQFDAMIVP